MTLRSSSGKGRRATLTLALSPADGGGNSISITPGQTVTLQLTADVAAGEGTPQTGVFAELVSSALGVVSFTGSLQNALTSFGGAAPWTLFPLQCGGDACWGLNQANPNIASPFPVDAFSGVIAELTIEGGTIGQTVIDIGNNFGNELNFFGLTAGDVGSVAVEVVPEPTTAGLMAIGLAGLALAGRRRR